MNTHLSLCFMVIALLNVAAYFIAVFAGHTALYAENNILENLQAIFALFAALVGVLHTRHNDSLLRLTGLYFTVLGLSVFLREVDVERLHYNIPTTLTWFGHGVGRNILLATLWFTLFWLTVKLWRKDIKPYLSQLFLSPTAILMACSFALLLVSDLCERNIFGNRHHVFYEEMFELNGYILFFAAAITAKLSIFRTKAYGHYSAHAKGIHFYE